MNNKSVAAIIIIAFIAVGIFIFMLVRTSKKFNAAVQTPPITETNNPADNTYITPETPKPTYATPPAPTAPAPKTYQVNIQNFAFSSNSLSIKRGDTVTWTNKDSAPHTVTGGGFSSGTLSTNGTYSFTFNSVGTFNYACSFHPSMKGSVVVTE